MLCRGPPAMWCVSGANGRRTADGKSGFMLIHATVPRSSVSLCICQQSPLTYACAIPTWGMPPSPVTVAFLALSPVRTEMACDFHSIRTAHPSQRNSGGQL